MDRSVKAAIVTACVFVAVAAVIVVFVVWQGTNALLKDESAAETPTKDLKSYATADPARLQSACEEAQLRLLKDEVEDNDRLSLRVSIDKYCKDK